MIQPSGVFAERLGMVVGIGLLTMMLFTTIAPFFLTVPPASVRLIDQQQTILQSVFMVLVGYLWGNSAGNKDLSSAVQKQASTLQEAQAALAPLTTDPSINLAPGESTTVKADV